MGEEIGVNCRLNPSYSTTLSLKSSASTPSSFNGRGTATSNEEQIQLGENKAYGLTTSVNSVRPSESVNRDSEVQTTVKVTRQRVSDADKPSNVNKKLIVFFVCTAIACAIISSVALVVSVWIAFKPSPSVIQPSMMDTVTNQLEQANQELSICNQNVSESDLDQINETSTQLNNKVLTLGGMLLEIKSRLHDLNETFPTQIGQRVSEMFITLDDVKDFFLEWAKVSECGPGLWRRVAYIDMTLPSHQCPSAWREYTSPVRTCGRQTFNICPSAFFQTHGLTYNRVCGRATAYQQGNTDGFRRFGQVQPIIMSLNDNYVDGISVTHGTPRTHIWTFAAGRSTWPDDDASCPCDNSSRAHPSPSFIGNNYFCETAGGNTIPNFGSFVLSNKLWDGPDSCLGDSPCCSFNSPPWFSVELLSSTTDDIEVRICGDEGIDNEDAAIELLEIYIQ